MSNDANKSSGSGAGGRDDKSGKAKAPETKTTAASREEKRDQTLVGVEAEDPDKIKHDGP